MEGSATEKCTIFNRKKNDTASDLLSPIYSVVKAGQAGHGGTNLKSLGRLRQEFEASLSYVARPYFKKQKQNKKLTTHVNLSKRKKFHLLVLSICESLKLGHVIKQHEFCKVIHVLIHLSMYSVHTENNLEAEADTVSCLSGIHVPLPDQCSSDLST
jgi:hypothetical protein